MTVLSPETNVADPRLWPEEACLGIFEAMRRDDPVHYCEQSPYGPYWSVTRYEDILAVDTNHDAFSSDAGLGGIVIDDNIVHGGDPDAVMRSFITSDPPRHTAQRKAVNPVVSRPSLQDFETLIRTRTRSVLDALPSDEPFNWVDLVSIELTTRMLATLFDFPYEERAKLTRWSDVITAEPGTGIVDTQEQRIAEAFECLDYFSRLKEERRGKTDANDLVSLLANDPATSDLEPLEFLGNIGLLIVGGNDTTRNSMTGGVWAAARDPELFARLKADRSAIGAMIAETIRWQTPLAHMRRTAKTDTALGGKTIKAGDKVVMWYVSGNRDEAMFPDGDSFDIDRENVRRHLSFGFGIHRCMGLRLAEVQLRVLWEEILDRWDRIEVVDRPTRVQSNFVRGFSDMTVRLCPHA